MKKPMTIEHRPVVVHYKEILIHVNKEITLGEIELKGSYDA